MSLEATRLPPKLAKYGDFFQGTLGDPQDLPSAIEAFPRNYIRGWGGNGAERTSAPTQDFASLTSAA
jgi:hypothetical protein